MSAWRRLWYAVRRQTVMAVQQALGLRPKRAPVRYRLRAPEPIEPVEAVTYAEFEEIDETELTAVDVRMEPPPAPKDAVPASLPKVDTVPGKRPRQLVPLDAIKTIRESPEVAAMRERAKRRQERLAEERAKKQARDEQQRLALEAQRRKLAEIRQRTETLQAALREENERSEAEQREEAARHERALERIRERNRTRPITLSAEASDATQNFGDALFEVARREEAKRLAADAVSRVGQDEEQWVAVSAHMRGQLRADEVVAQKRQEQALQASQRAVEQADAIRTLAQATGVESARPQPWVVRELKEGPKPKPREVLVAQSFIAEELESLQTAVDVVMHAKDPGQAPTMADQKARGAEVIEQAFQTVREQVGRQLDEMPFETTDVAETAAPKRSPLLDESLSEEESLAAVTPLHVQAEPDPLEELMLPSKEVVMDRPKPSPEVSVQAPEDASVDVPGAQATRSDFVSHEVYELEVQSAKIEPQTPSPEPQLAEAALNAELSVADPQDAVDEEEAADAVAEAKRAIAEAKRVAQERELEAREQRRAERERRDRARRDGHQRVHRKFPPTTCRIRRTITGSISSSSKCLRGRWIYSCSSFGATKSMSSIFR